jgi:hypothetical protein
MSAAPISLGTMKSSKAEKLLRLERFKAKLVSRQRDPVDLSQSANDADFEGVTSTSSTSPKRLKGKSTALEKPYVRVTGVANAEFVRPEKVLKAALDRVKARYEETQNYDTYACEQLKSIRQDLTLQRIKGGFCLHVYETHARLALVHGDESEFVQCHSRVLELRGVTHASDEFDCYRVLHALNAGKKLEIASALIEYSARSRRQGREYPPPASATAFALEVAEAVRTGNTSRFFELHQYAREKGVSRAIVPYKEKREQAFASPSRGSESGIGIVIGSGSPENDAGKRSDCGPGVGRDLSDGVIVTYQACHMMDRLVAKQRALCLERVLKAYLTIPVEDCCQLLGFPRAAALVGASEQNAAWTAFAEEQRLCIVSGSGAAGVAAAVHEPYIDCKLSLGKRSMSTPQQQHLGGAVSVENATVLNSDTGPGTSKKRKKSSENALSPSHSRSADKSADLKKEEKMPKKKKTARSE